jgi:hypothetical protein
VCSAHFFDQINKEQVQMKNEVPEELLKMLLGLRKTLVEARDASEAEESTESDESPCAVCGGDGGENDFLSYGANNPIFHCATTDSNVDIVTMKQDVTTFEVSLEEDAEKFYTYKTDSDVAVGDIMLVETVYGHQAAKVEVVHDEAQFIVDEYTIRWAICKLPMGEYDARQAADAVFGAVLSAAIDSAMENKVAAKEINKLSATREDLDKLLSTDK